MIKLGFSHIVSVMAGLVPAIHVCRVWMRSEGVDARPKAGHDGASRRPGAGHNLRGKAELLSNLLDAPHFRRLALFAHFARVGTQAHHRLVGDLPTTSPVSSLTVW